MELFIYLVILVYFVGCVIFLLHAMTEISHKGVRVYDIIFATIFLPVTAVFALSFILFIFVEWIKKTSSKSKIGKFLNKKVF